MLHIRSAFVMPQVDGKDLSAIPEESSVAPPCGAWGLAPAFAFGDVATGT